MSRRYRSANVVEHKEPDGGREVAVKTLLINTCHHARQGHVFAVCNLLQPAPKWTFQTDAGLMSGDDDRSLDDK